MGHTNPWMDHLNTRTDHLDTSTEHLNTRTEHHQPVALFFFLFLIQPILGLAPLILIRFAF